MSQGTVDWDLMAPQPQVGEALYGRPSDFALDRPSAVPSETANQLTHGLGFLLGVAASVVMLSAVFARPDPPRVIGCLVYVITLLGVYGASTLSHSYQEPRRLNFYRMLDQVCIFLFAAGSFTPFGMLHLREGAWPLLLGTIWCLALLGAVARIANGENSVACRFFAVIGWLPVLAMGHVYALSGLLGVGLVLGGGLAYTGGIWFLLNDHRHRYLHAVWHLCTITGSACHFFFLHWYVAEWPLRQVTGL